MGMSRRQFLQGGGLAAAGLALGSTPGEANADAPETRIKGLKASTTICPFCAVGCGLLVHTRGGKVVNIEGHRTKADLKARAEADKAAERKNSLALEPPVWIKDMPEVQAIWDDLVRKMEGIELLDGLDADMLSSVHPGLKRLTGEGAYWMAGLRQLTDWNPVPFTVETEDGPHRATFAVVANASSYGGGLRLAPDASMDDDLLDLCLFDSTQRHRFARYLAAAFSGSHLGMPGVSYVKARRAVALGPDNRLVHVDGELLGRLPVSFDCVPAALSLVVPVKPSR